MDAVIVSDPLVIQLLKEIGSKMEIHLSTQQSTLNYEAALYWKNEGVTRIVLAREASGSNIKEIIDKTGLEVEVFIHGAMCSGYSGRCVLSNYLTMKIQIVVDVVNMPLSLNYGMKKQGRYQMMAIMLLHQKTYLC